jgi:hypothetical protein
MAPGKLRRPDYEYKRCGTANVYCAVEPKAGVHFTIATPNRSAPQFAQAMETIIASYPNADTIHVVMDNLNIHGPKSLTDHFGKEKGTELWNRITVHYTPIHGSWLNQAEIEISLFARQCLGKRRIPTLAILQREAEAWNAKANHDRTKIDWNFTRKKARIKFGYKSSKKNLFTRSKTYATTIDCKPIPRQCALQRGILPPELVDLKPIANRVLILIQQFSRPTPRDCVSYNGSHDGVGNILSIVIGCLGVVDQVLRDAVCPIAYRVTAPSAFEAVFQQEPRDSGIPRAA